MSTKEEAYNSIQGLVARFTEQYDSYKQSDYNETLTRRDFIDPFFKALGWDVDNSAGFAEAYREVIHEDRVKTDKGNKAPDFSFRLSGGKKLFFVEAKKPSVLVKEDISVAYQVRRYGWNAKLAVSIVTDFEELAVYDCTKKPNPTDKAGIARIKYLRFTDYLNEFDYLWNTFSKESVQKGRFDSYIQTGTFKKGTATVDKEFLVSLDTWRTYLATAISLKNKLLGEDEINFAVQQTIDRLIFLRIAEDRRVELPETLKRAVAKSDCYVNLLEIFRKADEKYNSGLFDFKKDTISATLQIDSKVLKTIVGEMYFPCPYEFSEIPVEILGSAYEQFLGKTITIDKAHRAKIEEKPEVRKAGGVYYTPQYIVDYIVKNTVGKLIDGKTPKQVSELKICDPACGSGSFLIGAYQFLLDYHKNFYTENGTKVGKKESPVTPQGNLTSTEKKRILLNNIYGVDIDVNAVEVTKLSLLLKCMEGETATTIEQQQKLWHDRILPTLDNSIKCGNSLVDTDYYDGKIYSDDKDRVKPFNWQKAFPEMFSIVKPTFNQELKKQVEKVKNLQSDTSDLLNKYLVNEPIPDYSSNRGFDIIIGNPPYGATLIKEVDYYLRNKYQVANYQLDTYNLFIERGRKLLKIGGYLGYIIPSAWVASKYDFKLRRYLVEETCIENFIITPKQTFKQASVETCMLLLSNNKPSKQFIVERWDQSNGRFYTLNTNQIRIENNYDFPVYADEIENLTIQKIRKQDLKLKDIAEVVWGVKVYENAKGKPAQTGNESKQKIFHSTFKSKESHRPLIGGSEITRYFLKWKGGFIDYGEWLAAPRQPRWFEGERILVREVTANGIIQATYVEDDFVFSNSVDGIKIISKETKIKFLLGLINSKLISFYHANTSANAFKGAFPKVLLQDLRDLPVPKADSKIQMEIENLTNNLLKLNVEKSEVRLPDRITQIESKISYYETRINQLVYQLFNLTDDEISIIENQ